MKRHVGRRRFLWLLGGALALAASGHRSSAAEESWPGAEWKTISPREAGLDPTALVRARDYALTADGSGYITRGGRLVMSWGDSRRRYDLKSTTKSIGVTALALAIADGKIALDDKARKHHPSLAVPPDSNAATGWPERITILHLATQTAGFEKPGGYKKLVFAPGTQWHYSDGGPNWLAECVTLVYRRDIQELMFERVFTPIGITHDDLTWRKNAYRPAKIEGIPRREFGSGISANVNAMARIGLLYLRRGRWKERQLLPADFVDRARTTVPQTRGLPTHGGDFGKAANHYGLLWWNNADKSLPGVPASAYWSWGLYDSLIVVLPEEEIVVARTGRSWERKKSAGHYEVLAPFLDPIVEAAGRQAKKSGESRKQ